MNLTLNPFAKQHVDGFRAVKFLTLFLLCLCIATVACTIVYGSDTEPFPALFLGKTCLAAPKKSCSSTGCHVPQEGIRKIKHPLYLEERCMSCHLTPDDDRAEKVRKEPDSVCLSCHTKIEWNTETNQLAHPPGPKNCSTCHEPHASSIRSLLRSDKLLEDCAKCHKPFLDESQKLPYRHKHFQLATRCGFCHYAHQNSAEKFIREDTIASCLTCHDMSIRSKGGNLENIAQSLRDQPVTHGAMKHGACVRCHTPHGSKQPALLKKGYPAGSYGTYDAKNYALCFQCHSPDLVESADSTGVTNFNDQGKNLHQMHLAKIGRGRACHLCHEPHASQRVHLLREKLKFGNWDAPFEYEILKDGASCATACHRKVEYHRNQTTIPKPAYKNR